MTLLERLYDSLSAALVEKDLPCGVFEPVPFWQSSPRRRAFQKGDCRGEVTTSLALQMAARKGKSPLLLGKEMKELLEKSESLKLDLQKVELVPPGYLNFYFAPDMWIKEFLSLPAEPPLYSFSQDFLQDFRPQLYDWQTPAYPHRLFWVFYAYARIHSIQAHAKAVTPRAFCLTEQPLNLLIKEEEFMLIKHLCLWPLYVNVATAHRQPQRLTNYLYNLAENFNKIGENRKEATELGFITPDNLPLTQARLAVVEGVRVILKQGLEIFSLSPSPELH